MISHHCFSFGVGLLLQGSGGNVTCNSHKWLWALARVTQNLVLTKQGFINVLR